MEMTAEKRKALWIERADNSRDRAIKTTIEKVENSYKAYNRVNFSIDRWSDRDIVIKALKDWGFEMVGEPNAAENAMNGGWFIYVTLIKRTLSKFEGK